MNSYPILVEKFPPGTTTDLGCNDCGHWWHLSDPHEFMEYHEIGTCPRCKSFQIDARYEEGDKCPGCGKLSLELDHKGALKGACSRRCALQAEYAASLKAQA